MLTLKEVKHVRENLTCYIVGEVFRQSIDIARAVKLARELELEVKFELELEDWMSFAGEPESLYRRKFESGEWECYHAYVQDSTGNILASLGGVILGRDSESYRIGIEHELLAESIENLKKELNHAKT